MSNDSILSVFWTIVIKTVDYAEQGTLPRLLSLATFILQTSAATCMLLRRVKKCGPADVAVLAYEPPRMVKKPVLLSSAKCTAGSGTSVLCAVQV